MKNFRKAIIISSAISLAAVSCEKAGKAETSTTTAAESATYAANDAKTNDSISVAASQKVPDKKFVKTADVNMEVKDVYESTIYIEKKLTDMGGFVTESRLQTNVVSENTYETSEKEATLVKKFQTENTMEVRVPTEHLADFLTFVNDKNLFLNSRIISAEDVTNNAKIAQLEMDKLAKTGKVIDNMKNNGDKVDRTGDNAEQENQQKIANMKLADDLKYSTINLYLKEPNIRVAEIPVTNTNSIDAKYRFSFLYDMKSAFSTGFFIIEKILTGIVAVWPLLIIGISLWFLRSRFRKNSPKKTAEM